MIKNELRQEIPLKREPKGQGKGHLFSDSKLSGKRTAGKKTSGETSTWGHRRRNPQKKRGISQVTGQGGILYRFPHFALQSEAGD